MLEWTKVAIDSLNQKVDDPGQQNNVNVRTSELCEMTDKGGELPVE